MTVHLPDAVAAVLEQRAAERGVSVAEFISELVERSDRRRALRGLIGSVDLPVDEPFDIHRARDECRTNFCGSKTSSALTTPAAYAAPLRVRSIATNSSCSWSTRVLWWPRSTCAKCTTKRVLKPCSPTINPLSSRRS